MRTNKRKNEDQTMNYEEMLQIDPDALDVECLEQATLFMRVSKESARINHEETLAKSRLDVAQAECSDAIRKKPEKYEIDKPTEGAIFNKVLQHEDYVEALGEYHHIKHEAALVSSAVKAFEHRKRMIEMLVTLAGQEWYATPTVPRNLKHEQEKRHERIDRQNTERVQTRRKAKEERRSK